MGRGKWWRPTGEDEPAKQAIEATPQNDQPTEHLTQPQVQLTEQAPQPQVQPEPLKPEPAKIDPIAAMAEADDAPWARIKAQLAGGYERLIDQQIREGASKGLFENLPGAGKPQVFDDDQLVPEDDRLAYQMLKTSGFAPSWVEVRKEIADDIAKLREFTALARRRWPNANLARRGEMRNELLERIKKINDKILGYNISTPSMMVHLHMLIPSEELAAFEASVR